MTSASGDGSSAPSRPGALEPLGEPVPAAVVVGASAGGIEALLTLVPALPARLACPVLIVVHLPPQPPSRLAELLAAHCARPVREAADKERLESGTVYVAPPGYHLQVEPSGWLSLSADEPVHHCRPSIDVLFESAAHAFGARLLAIVLTGANADGAAGLRTVREAGGTGWVQAPHDARHADMPAAALAAAGADRVLTLAQLAQACGALPATPAPTPLPTPTPTPQALR